MPNWCSNTLNITGDAEDVAKVKSLILNDDDEIDFEVLLPMPIELGGVHGVWTTTEFKFFDKNPNRMGLLTPKDFAEQAAALCATLGDKSSEKIDINDINEIVETSNIIDKGISVEASIERVVRQWAALPHEQRTKEQCPIFNVSIRKLIDIMSIENKIYCGRQYGWQTDYYWAIDKWGTKWNVSETYPSQGGDDANNASYSFETAWACPDAWFYTLLERIREMGANVSITLNFAEDGMWFGGEIGIDTDGNEIDRTYSDDEIAEFLGLEDYDNSENEDEDDEQVAPINQ